MKKALVSVMLVLALVVSVVACARAAPTPTPIPTPTPTVRPSPTPTLIPTAGPTPTPTPVPTAGPTPTPTPVPTAGPTPTPTPTPTPVPTPTPRVPTGELRIALPTLYGEALHPYRETLNAGYYLENIYDYIIGSDDTGNLDPKASIVYKWEVSPDNLTWTLYIRDGVRFHNGDLLTPEDIKFSILEIGAKKSITSFWKDFTAHLTDPVENSMEVVPPDKLVVHLQMAWPQFLYSISDRGAAEGIVLPQKYYEEKGEDNFLRQPVGTGPYKFKEQKIGSYIKFEAVDYPHWRVGVPRYKYITYLPVPEEGTRVAMLQRGEVDVIKVSVSRASDLRGAGFPVYEKQGATEFDLWWEDASPVEFPNNPASKVEVRKALNYAIDKQKLVDTIMMGFGKVKGTFWNLLELAIGYPGREEADRRWPVLPYDPGKARQLLTDAGYPPGKLEMWLYSYETILPEQKMLTEAIAAYWKAIGIKVNILEMDYAAFRPHWANTAEPVGLPAVFPYATPARAVPSWRTWHLSSAWRQIWDYHGNELIEKDIEAQTTVEGYSEAIQRFFDYEYEQQWLIPIFTIGDLYATNKGITDWNIGNKSVRLNLQYLYRQK